MARWWWFGGAVEADEIVREIKAMKVGGFGGFEIQPVYPLALDDPNLGIRNKPYLSPDFLKAVSVAARTGREEGMRVDITLGSGWPFGGPHITPAKAASCVIKREIAVPKGASSANLPSLTEGERYLAAFVGTTISVAKSVDISGGRVTFAEADTDQTLYLVMQGRTRQSVKRPTVGAEGFVLDHLSETAVRTHLDAVGTPLLKAFGNDRPYAIFSDSLEAYGANWTDDLLVEFRVRRGYDLTPHLLSLFADSGISAGVRYDWGLTLSELVNERYLTQVSAWAKTHQTLFRSQTYGTPAVTLSSNRLVDQAEGEGAEWRSASSTRWASSANHIYGQAVTSAESFTWLHKGAFRATPLDIKAEADVLLLSGVNQFIVHGWPYSPPKVPEPGWALYAAAVFNDHNPWWPVMADVNLYLQRMSSLLRQGDNVADIAIYVPTEDIMSDFRPGKDVSVNDELRKHFPKAIIESMLDAGYNFDFIDGDAILSKGIRYPVMLLAEIEYITPVVYERIEAFVRGGGVVVVLGSPPKRAPGHADSDAKSHRVAQISAALFNNASDKAIVTDRRGLIPALKRVIAPDVDNLVSGTGFVHRRLPDGHLYFVANTTNVLVSSPFDFRLANKDGQVWDPVTGSVASFKPGDVVNLAPFESRLFLFGHAALAKSQAGQTTKSTTPPRSVALTEGWKFKLGMKARATSLKSFGSWADKQGSAHYSGPGIYSRDLDLTVEDLASPAVVLDFGDGRAGAANERKGPGYYAQFEAPVRDAAEVFVNDKRVGAVWCAPFAIDLKTFLKAGRNRLEIRVFNTAINTLAGRSPVDYAALNAKYGERFQPQNMNDLKPLPSGLLVAPLLRFEAAG